VTAHSCRLSHITDFIIIGLKVGKKHKRKKHSIINPKDEDIMPQTMPPLYEKSE